MVSSGGDVIVQLLAAVVCLSVASSQAVIPGVGSCAELTSSSVTYIPHPSDPCRVYACRSGMFVLPQAFGCPSNTYSLPGLGNPCSSCRAESSSTDDSVLASTTLPPGELGAYLGQSLTPPTGFMSAVSSVRVPGGYHLLVDATLRQCLDACLMTSYCLAVDYDFRSRDCHVHGTGTYCSDVITQTGFTHYKRVPCTAATGVTDMAVEVWSGYRVDGAESVPSCERCTLVDCLSTCYSDSSCFAVDHDAINMSCYTLNSSLACTSLTPASDFTHITTAHCATSIGSTAPSFSLSSVYSNFVAVRYKGPTSLPINWLGYPGSRVVGGYLIGYSTTGDRCVALCQLYDSCLAVDFNTVDGSCWVHSTSLNKCAPPIPTNYVYHVKKPPACGRITGTHQPYPFPVTVGASHL